MRILYLIDTLAFGGAERQFADLVRGVSKLEGIEPFVCYFTETEGGYKAQLTDLGVPVTLLERARKYDLNLLLKTHRYCVEKKIDLIHSFSPLAGLVATIYGRLARIPIVASTIRNAKDLNFKIYTSIRLQSFLADCFVANSYAGFGNRFKKMKTNFRVIYNGINPERFEINPVESQKVRKIYNLNRFKHVVSMVASLSRNKDFDTLIDAIPGVLKAKPMTGFLLVGDGSERSRLEKKVFHRSLEDNVVFTGYTHDVLEILANTHVSVLMTNASRHVEGTSNSLLESMGMGIPVVASIGGGTDEVVEDGINGMLVDPYDADGLSSAILDILDDPVLQKCFRGAGKRTVETKFGFERYIRDCAEVYQDLISR